MIELITISVFVLGVLLIAHSYVIYPLLLKLISKKSKENELFFEQQGLPQVVVLMAAYNEQKVIVQKMESIINSEYTEGKMKLWIGSDNSTDNTNSIVQEYAEKYSWIKFFPFYERNGKTGIINFLNQKILQSLICFW